jgi:hypothetical protein
MNTEPMTKEEMVAFLKEALKTNPRPRPNRAQTKAQLAEERLATASKPTAAVAQDVARTSDALAQRLRDERKAEQDIAYRQYNLDRVVEAMKGLQEEIIRLPYHRRSATVGPRDSDAHLHVSPEDQLWGKV